MRRFTALLTILGVGLGACSDSTGPNGQGAVAVRFGTVPASGGALVGAPASLAGAAAVDELTITGTNGTLVIQDIRFIVSEFELKRADGDDCEDERDDDDCEEFEDGPFLVDLPLDGGVDATALTTVPDGTYDRFEFEIEDLDSDSDDDNGERQRMAQVLAEMRAAYPNFPSGASMVVRGTFNGQPFTTYFDAEIEIESRLSPPFRVPDDGALRVELDPASWFRSGTQVMNLFALNGRVTEFDTQFRSGVRGCRRDD